MSEMIERVAKALQADDGSPCISSLKLKLCKEADGCICRSLARAAIEAMREPTEDMLLAGDCRTSVSARENTAVTWASMIDEALTDPDGGRYVHANHGAGR